MRGNPAFSWLQHWLSEDTTEVLPRTAALRDLCPFTVTLQQVDDAFRRLVEARVITRRTGTVHENRGHAAVRIIATGRVLKTPGCPFDAPIK